VIRPTTFILATALVLAPVVAVELGVRALVDSGRLPEAPSSNDITDVALANLARLGRPDVLIIGNSTARNAFQPDVLKDLVEEASGQRPAIQGVAQGAMNLRSQRLLVQGLAERGLLPETVIIGLSPGTLISGSDEGDWFIHSELGQAWSGCDGIDPLSAADCWLGKVSTAWRWRGRPDRLAESAVSGMPTTFDHEGRVLQENGWAWELPATQRRLRRVLPETLDMLDVHVNLPASEEAEFKRLVEELRLHGATVVAATQPYAPPLQEALITRNPDWADERSLTYARMAQSADIDIVEVEDFGDWWTPAAQHDLRHLSHEGAGPFTRQLWETPAFRDSLLEGLASDS
jgi:hypothetical protein